MREIELSAADIYPIISKTGLELKQIRAMHFQPDSLDVYFYALDDKGQKYWVGDDIAQGSMTFSIKWTDQVT